MASSPRCPWRVWSSRRNDYSSVHRRDGGRSSPSMSPAPGEGVRWLLGELEQQVLVLDGVQSECVVGVAGDHIESLAREMLLDQAQVLGPPDHAPDALVVTG